MDHLPRYTLRVPQMLLDQIGYIAEYEGRTKNREIEQLLKRRVAEFEREHGKIPLEAAPRRRERPAGQK